MKYRLRTLFVVTLVVAGCLAFTTNRYRRMRNANIAIAAVGEMFGSRTEGTPLMRELVGEDRYFENVATINFGPDRYGSRNLAISDQDLENLLPHISAFSNFRTLRLSNTRVTDDGIAMLQRLESLESLHLQSELVTDAGIIQLHSVTTLKYLEIGCDKVSDRALADLQAALPHLQVKRTPMQYNWARTTP